MHPAWLDGLAGLDRDPGFAPLLFQMPVRRITVDISGAPCLAEPLDLDPLDFGARASFALFAKLGAKSWRDGGSLRIIDEGRPIAHDLTGLLHGITAHQARYLAAIRPYATQIDLSLYRYVDFSGISEARWQVRAGRAWCTSQCRRAMPATVLDDAQDRMRDIALETGERLSGDAIVDCTIEHSGRVRVLEINPTRSTLPADGRDCRP